MPSLQHKIQLGYAALAAAVAGVVLLAYSDLSYLERNIAPDLAASRLLDAVLEIRRHEKNWFLYGGAKALAEVETYAQQAQGLIGAARPQLSALGGGDDLDRLEADLMRYRGLLAGWRDRSPGDGDQAREVRQTGRRLADAAEAIAQARQARLQEAIAQSGTTLLAVGALTILLAVIAARWLARRATRPLGLLVDKLSDIAAGRYDQVEPVSEDREILAVSSAVNRMLAELEARRRHLVQAEKLASLGTLVSGVAHELNNPLSNVSSSCQILLEELDTADPAQIREWLGQIDAETERARNIVRTLLEFSREGAFRKRHFALRPLVEQTLVLVGRGLAGRGAGAKVTLDIPHGLMVDADPQRLQQVLVNLLANALDAGGPQVSINLSARVADAAGFQMPEHSVCGRSGAPSPMGARGSQPAIPNLRPSYGAEAGNTVGAPPRRDRAKRNEPEGPRTTQSRRGAAPTGTNLASKFGIAVGRRLVLIKVSDSGPGIAPEVLPRVFDPFFTTKDVGHGSGLGLYVSQEIIDQHGGCIGVSSVPGDGTRFTIALPCDAPPDLETAIRPQMNAKNANDSEA